MRKNGRFQIFLALFMTLSMVQSAFAQDATPVAPVPGNLTIALADVNGAPVSGGCFDVVDASGAVSSFCDDDGDGRIELTNVPPGQATITQTSSPEGYTVAASVYANVLPDQTVHANVLATPEMKDDPFPEVVPTETQVADDNNNVDADATATAGEDNASSLQQQRPADFEIFAIELPNITCNPANNQPGVLNVEITAPTADEQPMDPAPEVSYTTTDRFGVVTGPFFDAELIWNAAESRYELSGSYEGDKIDFTITNPPGDPIGLNADCSVWNPIDLHIETMAKDAEGGDLPDGSQIGSSDTFSDTAIFVGEEVEFAPELAGQTVYYNLYKDDATCTTGPVAIYEVTIDENGNIPDMSELFDPSGSGLGDGIYDWQVVFPGAVLPGDQDNSRTFAEASSICGAETVIVGDVEVTVTTTMMSGDDQPLTNGAGIPIGSDIYDTTTLNGANDDVSGTVTYELYKGVCGDAQLIGEPEVVTIENGVVPPSSMFTPTELGEYFWVVNYSGDDNGNAAGESGCTEETFTVETATPEITTGMIADGESIENSDTVSLGTIVSDTTTIEGEYVPEGGVLGGTVTYTLLHGTCPGGTVVGSSGPLPLNADGTFPPSPDYSADLAGNYFWVVDYSGDDYNAANTSGCGDEYFEVVAIETTISTAPQVQDGEDFSDIPQNSVVPDGSDVRDTAAIGTSVDGSVPTGTVTYTLYGGSGCGSAPVAGPFVVELNEDGTVPPSPVVPGLTPGQYNWVAVYSGDETHAGSTGACGDEQFFVGQDGEIGGFVTTQVKNAVGGNVADGGTVGLGTYGYDTATFYGDIVNADGTASVDGELTFNVYATSSDGATCTGPIDSFTLTVTAGEAIPDSAADMFRYENAGTYDWQAVFTFGDGQSISSICGLETVNVDKVTPTFTTTMQLDSANQANNFRFSEAGSVSDTVTTTYDQTNLTDIPAPTGTLTYTLYLTTNNTCTGDPVFESGALNVANGTWPASGSHSVSVTDYGVYNWVVTFTPDTAGAVNYNSYTSGCNQETFRKDVQPTLTTEMYQSPENAGNGEVLPNGETVNVGDYVRDTATLTGFAEGATGTVTFRLHQGGTCEGTVLFENTVQVANGEAVSGTDWFRVSLFGDYSWSAHYSGDIDGNSNTFTTDADSDCSTETFTALELDGGPVEIETVMRDGSGAVIPHGSYVDAPISVTDQAVLYNLSDQATGTVTYELFDTATCGNAPIHTSVQDVANGMAPISDPYAIQNIGVPNGRIYSWIVVFQGTGDWSDISVTSPCTAEQFRAYDSLSFGLTTVCTYNQASNQMSVVVQLNPRTVGDTNPNMGATINYTPLNLDLSTTDPTSHEVRLDPGDSWIVNLGTEWPASGDYQDWRRVTGTVTWDQAGSGGTFRLGCNTAKFNPEITTTMFYRDGEEEVVLEQNGSVPYGTTVFDTTQVTNETSTVIVSGTLTYTLYSDETCTTQVGQTVRTLGDDTPIGTLPASEDFTLTQAGTYYWVVEYSGDANNNAAISECGEEVFSIDPTSPDLTTVMHHSDEAGTPGDVIANEAIIPIDSIVTDTATIAGNSEDATGTVTYQLFRGGVCGDDGILADGESLGTWEVELESGLIPNVGEGIHIENVGFYTWIVTYEGDSNNDPAVSGCGLETFEVELTTPELTTVMHHADEVGTPGDVIANEAIIPIDSIVTDTVTIEGNSENATGTVTYQLFRGGVCGDDGILAGGESLGTWEVELENGLIPNVGEGIQIENVGFYTWIVTYEGDSNNEAAVSGCGLETFEVEPTTPSVSTIMLDDGVETLGTAAAPALVAIDSFVGDTATIEPLSNNATGTVTYTLIRAEDCSVADPEEIFSQQYDLADAVTPAMGEDGAGIKIENVGTYHWIVEYSGDSNNNGAISECGNETFIVEQATPEIETVQHFSDDEGVLGEVLEDGSTIDIDSIVTDTAAMNGQSDNATGTVTYQLFQNGTCVDDVITNGTPIGSPITVDLAGDGSIPNAGVGITIENVGTYTWIVTYSGDANNQAYTTPCDYETFVVDPTNATTVTTMLDDGEEIVGTASAPALVEIDSYVADTAEIDVLSNNVTGTVTYTLIRAEDCSVADPEVIFSQQYDLADALSPAMGEDGAGIKIENVGTYHWIVEYSGDANNNASISECGEETFVVEPTDPTVVTVMLDDGAEITGTADKPAEVVIDSFVGDTATIVDPDLGRLSDNATGTVTYTLIRAEDCSVAEPEVIFSQEYDLADGLSPAMGEGGAGIKIENVGTYHWIVEYSGDANNNGAISPCGEESFIVETARSSIETAQYFSNDAGELVEPLADGSTIEIDSVVTDSAVIAGQSDNATGTVTYELFQGGVCGEDGVITDGTSLGTWEFELVDGTIPNVGEGVKIENVGTYTWIVSYSGDDNNDAYTTPCDYETFVVPTTGPEITTTMYFYDESGEPGEIIANESIVPIDSIVTDTAVIDGQSDNATGLVTYGLYHGGVCEDGVLHGATLLGTWEFNLENGLIPNVGEGIKIENIGLYTWIVTYTGDENNDAAISGCGLETLEVEPTNPTVVTEMIKVDGEDTSVIDNGDMLDRGAIVFDTAVISGQSDNATGTVTYQFYADVLCTVPFADPYVVNLANGEIPDSRTYPIPDAGSYYWVVTYSGDANNEAAVSECGDEFFHVEQVSPSVLTTMQYENGDVIENNDVVFTDSSVQDTAQLLGATDDASGTATYQLFSDVACTIPVTDPEEVVVANGKIPNSSPFTVTETGTYFWVVTYSGDANNAAAISGCGEEFFQAELMTPSVVTTMEYENGKLIENDDIVFTGNAVIDTAELIGATDNASGTATYQLFSDAACTIPVTEPEEVAVANGVILDSSPFMVTEPGTYFWVVTYSGDANNAAAISDCGEEFFNAEEPPAAPSTPPVVSELPSTGSGGQGSWILPSLFGLVAAAFVASILRLKTLNR